MFDRCDALLILNSLREDLSFARYSKLMEEFGTPEAILAQPEDSLATVPGVGAKTAHVISHWREIFDLDQELKLIQKEKIALFFWEAPDYPTPLRVIPDPPLVLYCRGKLTDGDERAAGIVGSRAPSHYGKTTAHRLAKELAQLGWTVVSGLAFGIDAAAHRGALDGGGRTLAVLGQGLATEIYPPENLQLAREIAEHGAVLSEFPMTFAPMPRNFPRRNRIISGLSRGVLVVEATQKSGALITTDFALEQGKPVLAVPGRLDMATSEGPNHLIQQGAKLVMTVRDILEELTPEYEKIPHSPSAQENFSFVLDHLPEEEKILIQCLNSEEKQLDTLLEETRLPAPAVTHALFSLELKNLVKQLPGQYYVRV